MDLKNKVFGLQCYTPRRSEGDSEGENWIFKKPLRKQAWSFKFLVAIIMLALVPKIANRLKRGDKRKTRLDRIAMHHDIAYSKARNLQDK